MRIGEQDRLLGRGIAGVPQQRIVKATAVQNPFGVRQARHFFGRGADHDNRVVNSAILEHE